MYELLEPKTASGVKMLLIRIFGKKTTARADKHELTAYRFRGITYIDKWRER